MFLGALQIRKLTGPRLVGSVEHLLEQRTQSLLGEDLIGDRSGDKFIEFFGANLWATAG
ncbi:hypothetical protein [Porphyrobacter sp. HT-58-2]|uniref:hypothetical protein n=1 Tax=Porphyrobacter sp. HT-58-2 TaxID=2023229 RepID=UPI0015598B7E|nr:hypothetical protein [Porphyrobacter sp. HT-58-2]